MFRRLLRALTIVATILVPLQALPAAAAPSGRATLSGNVPPWARSANFKSAANGNDDVGFRVYLNWQNSSGVGSLARAVSDPKSSKFHQYLTPQ
ncbi:MAG TPA: protease pro-enzyme activation domain-containing protein, partial [Chloroflexota bacterium]|nr:protease pro-enzyme activation domain-containing protein [Chloroflexota bacterium]